MATTKALELAQLAFGIDVNANGEITNIGTLSSLDISGDISTSTLSASGNTNFSAYSFAGDGRVTIAPTSNTASTIFVGDNNTTNYFGIKIQGSQDGVSTGLEVWPREYINADANTAIFARYGAYSLAYTDNQEYTFRNWDAQANGGTGNYTEVMTLDTSSNVTIHNDLTVSGNFIVSGNTTSVNSNELNIEDKVITLASGSANTTVASGAGIEIDGTTANLLYNASIDGFKFNKTVQLDGNGRELQFNGGNNRILFNNYRAMEGNTSGSVLQIGEGYSGSGAETRLYSPSYKIGSGADTTRGEIHWIVGSGPDYNLLTGINYSNSKTDVEQIWSEYQVTANTSSYAIRKRVAGDTGTAGYKFIIDNSNQVGIANNTAPDRSLDIGRHASGDDIPYGIRVSRGGVAGDPSPWLDSPALEIFSYEGQGPTANTATNEAIFKMTLNRFADSDTNAEYASLMHVQFDTTWSPLRLDGQGNMWIGWNRGSGDVNTGKFQGIFRDGVIVGSSYQTTVAPVGGAIFAGNVGIGTDSPNALYSDAANLVVGSGSGNEGMTIFTGTDGIGALYFADGTTNEQRYKGFVEYVHGGETGLFGGGDVLRLGTYNGAMLIADASQGTWSFGNGVETASRNLVRFLGLNTNNPLGDTDALYDSQSDSFIRIANMDDTATNQSTGIIFRAKSAGAAAGAFYLERQDANYTGDFIFRLRDGDNASGSKERLRIKNTGSLVSKTEAPTIRPAFSVDFVNSRAMDPRFTFTRASRGTYTDKNGLVKYASANEPRFTHDPITGECKGLLMERGKTNYQLNSDNLLNWTNFNGGTRQVSTTYKAPDGVSYATEFKRGTSGTYWYEVGANSHALSTSGWFSVWIKAVDYSKCNAVAIALHSNAFSPSRYAHFNLETGDWNGSISGGYTLDSDYWFEKYPNNWYRVGVRSTSLSSYGYFDWGFHPHLIDSNGNISSIDDVSSSSGDLMFLAWGAQFETDANVTVPTSYISSTTSVTVRAADYCIAYSPITDGIIQENDSIYEKRSFYVEAEHWPNDDNYIFQVGNSDSDDRYLVKGEPPSGVRWYVEAQGTNVTSGWSSDSTERGYGNVLKVAAAHQFNDSRAYTAQENSMTDGNCHSPTLDSTTQISLGSLYGASGTELSGYIRKFAIYNDALTRPELQTLVEV